MKGNPFQIEIKLTIVTVNAERLECHLVALVDLLAMLYPIYISNWGIMFRPVYPAK